MEKQRSEQSSSADLLTSSAQTLREKKISVNLFFLSVSILLFPPVFPLKHVCKEFEVVCLSWFEHDSAENPPRVLCTFTCAGKVPNICCSFCHVQD